MRGKHFRPVSMVFHQNFINIMWHYINKERGDKSFIKIEIVSWE